MFNVLFQKDTWKNFTYLEPSGRAATVFFDFILSLWIQMTNKKEIPQAVSSSSNVGENGIYCVNTIVEVIG